VKGNEVELRKLAETVLLELECFWVLQELDERLRSDDRTAVALLENLYARRSVSWHEVHPLVRLNTVLALLVVPISFVARHSEQELSSFGFCIKNEYKVICRQEGKDCVLAPRDFLLVLRNAVAHLPDFAFGTSSDANISFTEGVLRCWSSTKSREIVFQTEKGFVEFLRDLVSICREAAKKLTGAQ
jgi:hypothetical protein